MSHNYVPEVPEFTIAIKFKHHTVSWSLRQITVLPLRRFVITRIMLTSEGEGGVQHPPHLFCLFRIVLLMNIKSLVCDEVNKISMICFDEGIAAMVSFDVLKKMRVGI